MPDTAPVPPGLALEYNALRDEVMDRIQLRSQVMLATLTLAGIVFGVGLSSPAVAFVFPVLATFLSAAWLQHDARISEITTYIREQIEPRLPGLGWESSRRQRVKRSTRILGLRLAALSAGGTFVVMQLVALIIGFSRYANFGPFEWIFGAISAAFTVFTVLLMRLPHRADRTS
jgi:hypothetical protein